MFMESTPYRDNDNDPMPSYLENTKSTAYKWDRDLTDSTAHPSIGDNTTREHDISLHEDEDARLDRVRQLASLLDDLDASAKISRVRTDQSYADSPQHAKQSTNKSAPSKMSSHHHHELSDDDNDEDLHSDLDEMINNMPSDEEPDPTISPAPIQATAFAKQNDKNNSGSIRGARNILRASSPSPIRGLKSAQKTPAAAKTPAKTVDFQDPRHPKNTPGYVAPSPIERRPSSPRKFSAGELPPRQPSPSPAGDAGLKQLAVQLATLQEELRKRDVIMQDLYKQIQSPLPTKTTSALPPGVEQQLADAHREIEKLKESHSQLRRSQEEVISMSSPGRTTRVERNSKWQEFLDTPISISQRKGRRDTPKSRVVAEDTEDILPAMNQKVPPMSPARQEKQPEEDEIVRLEEALAKAESQITQLKMEKAAGKGPGEGHEFHAKPLTPNMMPDAKNSKLAREEKLYYRLGLYKIDRLCSNETANLLKNILIQLETPLDQLIYEITHLSRKMHEYDRLRQFAMGVHEKLYAGEKMELAEGEGTDVECLREMLTRVGKLASRRK